VDKKIVYLGGNDDDDDSDGGGVSMPGEEPGEDEHQGGPDENEALQSDDDNISDTEEGSENSMSTNGIISIHPLQLILSRFLTTSKQNDTDDATRTITNVLEDILTELKYLNKTMKSQQ
jgi:hypothetical protein